jgi:hypothetical protein
MILRQYYILFKYRLKAIAQYRITHFINHFIADKINLNSCLINQKKTSCVKLSLSIVLTSSSI